MGNRVVTQEKAKKFANDENFDLFYEVSAKECKSKRFFQKKSKNLGNIENNDNIPDNNLKKMFEEITKEYSKVNDNFGMNNFPNIFFNSKKEISKIYFK